MPLIQPQDAAFLLLESREHPNHVAVLQLFELPPDAGEDYVGDLYRELLQHDELRSKFRTRPAAPVSSVGRLWWTQDDEVDLEYHVRLTSLPRPRKVRQLLELVSRLHGTLLDRHRPLWEFYLIEGLEGNRFATYAKIHHSLVDGVAGMRLLTGALSEDPAGVSAPMWAPRGDRPRADGPAGAGGGPWDAVRSAAGSLRELAGLVPLMAKAASGQMAGDADATPMPAPKTMLNTSITGARRFAAQTWDIDRIKKAADGASGTLNDVVLAMCAGALRRYLIEQDALPDQPLVAMVPVSLALRGGSAGGGGNAIGGVRCNLATDEPDPHRRLARIIASMRAAKDGLADQTPGQIQVLSTALAGGPVLLGTIPGVADVAPPLFNVIISNVPGPRSSLYWNGARMQGIYPVSIPTEGQALNITVTSYDGGMHFGLIGCRRRVPHLQRLLGHLEDSLAEV